VYACKEWRYHASLFLLEESASQRIDDNIEEETKKIDSKWIKFWMNKVGAVVGSSYVSINLPKVSLWCLSTNTCLTALKAKSDMHQRLYESLQDSDAIFHVRGDGLALNAADIHDVYLMHT
jgi:hypothetical protein